MHDEIGRHRKGSLRGTRVAFRDGKGAKGCIWDRNGREGREGMIKTAYDIKPRYMICLLLRGRRLGAKRIRQE